MRLEVNLCQIRLSLRAYLCANSDDETKHVDVHILGKLHGVLLYGSVEYELILYDFGRRKF